MEATRAARLAGKDRKDMLLSAAATLIQSQGVEAVSMEAVADVAAVSRPLVYKHFANRERLLAELYRREATRLYEELAEVVESAPTVLAAYRALLHGSLAATARGLQTFKALRAAGAYNESLRQEQQDRDRTTIRYFSRRAVRELGVPEHLAPVATGMLLSMIDGMLAQFRRHPTPARAEALEEVYVRLVTAGLRDLADPYGGSA